jgi:Ankyrin repeats (many copies)
MKNADITDPLFLTAVEAIDAGNIALLEQLLIANPRLVTERLNFPEEGYFRQPYLLWFIADNPIRHEHLPANIAAITHLLIQYVQAHAVKTFTEQINYTLALVTTGRIPKECGVQIELIDLLIDAGATSDSVHGALAHGNIDAANHLIKRGSKLTLTAAVCLDKTADIVPLSMQATAADHCIALVAAAFYGKYNMLDFLMKQGADINAFISPASGFHSHATALHQAVFSGSIESVKVLTAANARLDLKDKIYQGTPLDWAIHLQTEEKNKTVKKKYAAIEIYLRGKEPAG